MLRVFHTTVIVGDGEGEVKGKTVKEIIKNLCDAKGAEFRDSLYKEGSNRISDQYIILLNGKRVDTASELNKKVKKGDRVVITPDIGACC